VTYEYNAAGYRTKRNLANNTFAEYQYDDAGQLTNLVHKVISSGATNVLSSYAYGYDDTGYRKWDKRSSGRGDVYKYDASDQLTNVVYDATNPDTTPSGGTNLVTYYFDAAANRTSVVQVIPNTSTNTTTYLVNKLNQYTNVSNQTYTYDAKGNLTNDGSQTYSFDYESRLIEAYAYPYTYTYSYDVVGRLAGRKRGTVWNRYYYAGWQLIEERAHAGGLLAKYVYGPGLDEPVRMYRSSTNYYYHTDSLGNVTEITDGSGNLVEQYSYDVYGKPTIRDGVTNVLSASAIGNRLMFNARDRDPDTLLYNYRYRYYSPGLGRFVQPDPIIRLSRDPIQEYGGHNLYSYISNNPINRTDPLGLSGYGNPVSGPNGPVGPSSPYAPGGLYYPNGYLYTPAPDPVGECKSRCFAANRAGWALGALGLASGTVGSIPKPVGAGALGSGGATTGFSIIEFLGGPALRNIGRQLNPFGRAVQCASGGYLLGLEISCTALCSNDPDSF
jgi:RHS repeat-associated protein